MAATSNFLQFNPSAQNQESDSAYLADPQRTGGATVGATFPSPLANKLFFQSSTFVAAFAAMMAAKGYTMADTSLATLQTALANVLTAADVPALMTLLSYSATPAFDASASSGFQMTLNGDITSSTISGIKPGQLLAFIFQQDATGGRTVSWPGSFVAALQPHPAPNAVSVLLFIADNLGVPRSIIPNIGVTDVSGSRSSGTVYQNTTGAPLFVNVGGNNSAGTGTGGQLNAVVGITSSPATHVATNSVTNSSGPFGVNFMVPNGWYYAVTLSSDGGSGSGLSITFWVENAYV